ncbi:TonB-dependent receptor [Fodinibius saliphilus]|uniref:TonB-dependent receptor n=1 Tax=Fodinibius saliphilus TaxID=1920650 RepID=UPI001108F590|nr:TonB-dependent receptor [Fodinibius saliphilus]
MKRYSIVLLMFLLIPLIGLGQGVTTSSIKGTVVSESGESLPGANILARHLPTGTEYGAATNSNGAFNIRNMRAGGPYRIRVTFVGYDAYVREGFQLELGETLSLEVSLSEGSTELGEVTVTAAGDVFNKTKTGIGKNVSTEDIEDAPTVGRSLADYTRLNPQAFVVNSDDDGAAISIAGQNNRFNSIFIDGAVNNDVFGLSAQGTNGGQTGASPISMDAIEQFQINSSPFDVTQGGFTGGAINAITRSGTNKFEGSAYWFNRNEGLAGKTPIGLANFNNSDREALPAFKNNRFGFRLGGPIIEDKLFFFANLEMLRSQSPRPFLGINSYQGDATISKLEEISTTLQNEVGYDPGTFRDKNSSLDSDKALFKLNWNINKDHKLMLRHSYTASDNTDRFQSGVGTINYKKNSEVFPNTTHSTALELTSSLGDRMANKLTIGYTDVLDDRDFAGEAFPTVTIFDGDGDISLGNEPFSTSNLLDQQILTVTNDFNIFAGDHTITIGTHNEFYDMANQFIPFNNGWYFYFGADDFLQSVRAVNDPNISPATPALYLRGVSLVGGQNTIGDAAQNTGAFKAYQLGLYVQDEWQVTDDLRLTGGLRFDMPKVSTDPGYADDVFNTTIPDLQAAGKNLKGARPGETPKAQLYISPRFGVNWDVDGEGTTQLRAGAGVFLGRVPFVWPGGMFLNNGANTGIIEAGIFEGEFTLDNGDPIPFRPDPTNGLTLEDFGQPGIPSGRLEMFADDFRYPTVFRTSIGVDQRLPYDIIGTFEVQYTKTVNNIVIENVNLKSQNGTLDGPDTRPFYNYSGSDRYIDSRYSNIHVVSNTNDGHAYDFTVQLRKSFSDNFRTNVAWTYGDSYVLNEGTSSQINSLWDGQEHVNGANNLSLSRSDFSMGHRLTASLVYRKQFLGNLATTISLFYEGTSGRPFSYVIDQSENLVNEGGDDASLIYVPEDASNLTWAPITDGNNNVIYTVSEQIAAFNEFIESSDYLSSRRGQYAERNASRAPFEHIIDLKVEQELFADFMNRRHKLEFTLDIFNFTALLGDLFDKSWGSRYNVGGTYEPIEFIEFQDPGNGDYTPVYNLNYDPNSIKNTDDMFQQSIQDFGTYSSRWLMQFGIRYTF